MRDRNAAPLAPAGDARAAAGRQVARDLAGTGPKAAPYLGTDPNHREDLVSDVTNETDHGAGDDRRR